MKLLLALLSVTAYGEPAEIRNKLSSREVMLTIQNIELRIQLESAKFMQAVQAQKDAHLEFTRLQGEALKTKEAACKDAGGVKAEDCDYSKNVVVKKQ